ncbi:MAG TPA: FkbM family methyltransferase [Candidatus Eisenbacteria bacterium]|nr:FkbM family methyltransferase [Candidatus Eisenbacteria bacterium]
MAEANNRFANLLLRYAAPLYWLRRVPLVGNLLSWTSRKLVPRESLIWVQIQSGPAKDLWMRVNPRTGQTVQNGTGEPEVQQALADHLTPGMTFYDLGANIGFFSLLAARLTGSHGGVFSFEADPEIAARLRENLSRNHFANAQVEQKAVWSETKKVFFTRVDPSTSPDRGLGHVSADSHASGAIEVEAVTLDAFAASHPAPDFLKCDVEGAEVAVFEGAAALLPARRPILLVEMHSPENHHFLVERFTSLGYFCRNLDETHVLALPQ